MFSKDELPFLHEAILLFNDEAFYECHEILEELWEKLKGEEKQWIQGLLQISVGFYHLRTDNEKGCRSQFTKSLDKFSQNSHHHMPFRLESILDIVKGIATGFIIFNPNYNAPKIKFDERSKYSI